MDSLNEYFEGYPSQLKVANLLFARGIKVIGGKAYCGEIEQTDSAIGRAADVDRRVVHATLARISSVPELDTIFSKLECMLSMEYIAPEIGCSSLTIEPTDAKMSGILSGVMNIIYKHGLSVRQAMVDDKGKREDSVLTVVIDGSLPPGLITELESCRGVSRIILNVKSKTDQTNLTAVP
ncbi:MAG: regulator of amino acid metabolism, contains ACT domain protein [Candidatus Methanomethylophilaceae archaeon]|nr:regulator of amino acid metabolism, contains ACT domain protein [Candidatus Methanomethylophilaceae archaeon]